MARFVTALSIIVWVLASAASASAKGYPLVFDRVSARPGDTVTVFVPGTAPTDVLDPNFAAVDAPVYLVRVADVDDVRRFLPRDPRLVRVGSFEGILGYAGRATFELPDLAPGSYTSAVLVGAGFYVTWPTTGRRVLRVTRRPRADAVLVPAAAVLAATALLAFAIGGLRTRYSY